MAAVAERCDYMYAITFNKNSMPTFEETVSLDDFGEACGHFKGGPGAKVLRVASDQQLLIGRS